MNGRRKIESILIANRGEIAVRIVRTVKQMGLRAILVHHASDADSPGVALADEAIEINGATPVAAYLNSAEIITIALRAGAQAIHPGYGFLSENADFARAVEHAGLVFVGPRPETIELLGDKVRARNFMVKHGFPVAPSAIEDDDPATFVARARALGAPLLIKPAAGGGGKGMRIVRDMASLEDELARARSEGKRYFGDGRLYVERYVERSRHIEVQVLGDAYGNAIHLFERECSVQRRFQKIVEESPSPALSANVRKEICDVAVGIAREAKYRNAGTVEFIYGDGAFYFLEMNTRLQVEHPVTEMITGRDLVAEQIRVAQGEPLGYNQRDIVAKGHAIELRIYAEDAARGFVPTTGRVLVLEPPTGDGIRVDAGIRAGQTVTSAFDPMLAKLIVHAASRTEAIEQARQALQRFVLLGCRTNIGFLDRLMDSAQFRAGDIHTGLIEAMPELAADPKLPERTVQVLLAAAALSVPRLVDAAREIPALHTALGGWRN